MRTYYYLTLLAIGFIIGGFLEIARAEDQWPPMPTISESTTMSADVVKKCLNAQVEYYDSICGEQRLASTDGKNAKMAHMSGVACAVQEAKACLGIVDGLETQGARE